MGNKLGQLTNPYDWSRPVTTLSEFAGRVEEIDRIEKMFDAVANGHCLNFAILGDRACGKSSLLNIIAQKAREKGAIAVKVDLNETLAKSDLDLLVEIFDQIIEAGTSRELLDKEAYEAWRNNVDFYNIGKEPSNELLRIGPFFANAKSKSLSPTVRPTVVQNDFMALIEQCKHKDIPFLLIEIDEGDLLIKNKGFLELLRNLMQNLTQVIFGLAGTNQLFNAITDIFSPIPRQFSKIHLKNFSSLSETIDCVFKPLEVQGIPRSVIRKHIEFSTIYTLHQRTKGNPYHIKLLAHFMFEDFKERSDDREKIEINKRVLSRVYKNIADSSSDSRQRLQENLTRCAKEQLQAISALMQYDGLTIYDAAIAKSCFRQAALKNLQEQVGSIIKEYGKVDSTGILGLNCGNHASHPTIKDLSDKEILWKDCKIEFAGDSLDKLFLQYYITENLEVEFIPFVEYQSLEEAIFVRTIEWIFKKYIKFIRDVFGKQPIPFIIPKSGIFSTAEYESICNTSYLSILNEMVAYLSDEKQMDKAFELGKQIGVDEAIEYFSGANLCHIMHVSGKVKNHSFYVRFYQPIFTEEIDISRLQLPFDNRDIDSWEPTEWKVVTSPDTEHDEDLSAFGIQIENVQSILLNEKAISALSALAFKQRTESMFKFIEQSHYDDALAQAESIFLIQKTVPSLNNQGFVKMLVGDLDGAREDFNRALTKASSFVTSNFNLAYLDFREGNLQKSEEGFRKVVKLVQKIPKEERKHAYLKVPLTRPNPPLKFNEDWDLVKDPDILVCSYCALAILCSLSDRRANAEGFLKKAFELELQKTIVNRTKSWCLYYWGETDEAISLSEHLKTIVDLNTHGLSKPQIEADLFFFGSLQK